jgi:predicted amidohydrolase
VRIAAVQHDIVWEDRDANFERLAPQVARAVGAGAELVLLTETFSTGFSMTPGIGEPEAGPSARFLAGQAAEHGVWVAGTCPEIADGTGGEGGGITGGEGGGITGGEGGGMKELPYNSFVLAGPDGTTHRYRKLHPFTHAGEHERFRAGEKPVTVEVGGLRITPFICYDLRFADVFWKAAPDTDVYLVPANWPSPRRLHWQTLLQARAIENQAYVVGCNRIGTAGDGTEHAGDSRIVSPMGELLATAAGVETVVLADVDPTEVAATRDRLRFIPDRRG